LFYIQAGSPRVKIETPVTEEQLRDAIETVFPLDTERCYLIWPTTPVTPIILCYKYDWPALIEDVLELLELMRNNPNGHFATNFFSDTFTARWDCTWTESGLIIRPEWGFVLGDLAALRGQDSIKLDRDAFDAEWKAPLERILNAVSHPLVAIQNQKDVARLRDVVRSIPAFGYLYS